MSTEMDDVQVDPRELPAGSFTASDIARIELGSAAESAAMSLGRYAQMLGEDLAVAGDYVRQAAHRRRGVDSLVSAAVIAERVRGTSWEVIGDALCMSAEEAQRKWGRDEASWHNRSVVDSLVLKDPGSRAAKVDRYITTDKPYQFGTAVRRPLSASLDAAAHLTGRDVAAADHAFAGTVCTACSH
ncbi:hypothetical protein EF914_29670 [Streptomyces sp. WAC05458]|uniref:hypothetical protein n=1 Tax=Streptomyces sp. WAC05458 TaxID=2487412 RepID=UPI000F9ACDC8|nr:hypothetical protein [Streptomyces sp. WAC05458]RSS15400.1 hypothetical protein EF914_29670 [Streptomyces sp. WAC05458]